jgi:ankyrin repeat protein
MSIAKKVALALAIVGVLILGAVVWFFAAFYISMERGEARGRQLREELRSGKADFGENPELFAVAQAIVKNDQDAIRAAAKAVPDLQTPGREGATLLYFAVTQSWQRPELVEAVRTLLSLGADPNHTNGQARSFAMAAAVHSSSAVLQAMLDAGGNPNGRDEFGRPIILMTWYLGYYKQDERTRVRLLLDRGADVNATMPDRHSDEDGYSLLLYRLRSADYDSNAYTDAIYLLDRGADPSRAGRDGMTFAKMLARDQANFSRKQIAPPWQFTALVEWAQSHGVISAKP